MANPWAASFTPASIDLHLRNCAPGQLLTADSASDVAIDKCFSGCSGNQALAKWDYHPYHNTAPEPSIERGTWLKHSGKYITCHERHKTLIAARNYRRRFCDMTLVYSSMVLERAHDKDMTSRLIPQRFPHNGEWREGGVILTPGIILVANCQNRAASHPGH